MTRARARAMVWLCVVLGACAVDRSLGSHDPALLRHGEPQQQATDATTAEPTEPAAAPSAEPSHDAGDTIPPAHETAQDAAIEPPPQDEPPPEEPPPEEPPPTEPPPEEPPPEEPPPMEPPPELPAVCTAASDDTCRLCQQDACCETLHACSEHEVCHCQLECRDAAEPDACAEGCGAVPDVLATLDACLSEHCAEQCPH